MSDVVLEPLGDNSHDYRTIEAAQSQSMSH